MMISLSFSAFLSFPGSIFDRVRAHGSNSIPAHVQFPEIDWFSFDT